jgi:WD40 repeat protein
LDTASRYIVERGFSGAGLWSHEYNAVIGIVGQAKEGVNNRGDGRAITIAAAETFLESEELWRLSQWKATEASEGALAAWGWTLAADGEAERHWRPRARGVSVDSETGYRFRGRRAALEAVTYWLSRDTSDRRVMIVTGSPGVGKSAVLGRIITTADPTIRAALPADDTNVKAPLGSIACAVHAKGKTALDVANEIARAASLSLPQAPEEIASSLRDALLNRPGRKFSVVIDALDEASSPKQARLIISAIILPILQICSNHGAQVLVGCRRSDDDGDILAAFASGAEVVDLDSEKYFQEEDLFQYALATLQLVGDERPGNPYSNRLSAVPLARRIAQMAQRNFLVAGLVARTHALHDSVPASLEGLTFPPTVDEALTGYLHQLPPSGAIQPVDLLTGLAYAQSPGFSVPLWCVALKALGREVSEESLTRFAQSSAANFLLESSEDGSTTSYRLFHQALNDALIRRRGILRRPDDERLITRGLILFGQTAGWSRAGRYLLQALPAHAARAGMVDDLLLDDEYLLSADLLRLAQVADYASTPVSRSRARLLRFTPSAAHATAGLRAALFSVTVAVERLRSEVTATETMPYRAMWAAVTPRDEHALLEGHDGPVLDVERFAADGRELVASAGVDGMIRIWDVASSQLERTIKAHSGAINTLAVIRVAGRLYLTSGGDDALVRVWDPITGHQFRKLSDFIAPINQVGSLRLGGREVLASISGTRAIRVWDITGKREQIVSMVPLSGVRKICIAQMASRMVLVTCSEHSIFLWDCEEKRTLRTLTQEGGIVRSLHFFTSAEGEFLVSGTADGKITIWNLLDGSEVRTLDCHEEAVTAICAVSVGGSVCLATGSADRTIRILDAGTGETLQILTGHKGEVNALRATRAGNRPLLVSCSDDETVRLWDPAGRVMGDLKLGGAPAQSIATFHAAGKHQVMVADGREDVRITTLTRGHPLRSLRGPAPVTSVDVTSLDGRQVLASGGSDGFITLWDPENHRQLRRFAAHSHWVNDLCSLRIGRRHLLVSAGGDRAIRLWDLDAGGIFRSAVDQLRGRRRKLVGHDGWVLCLTAIERDQEDPLLASGGADGLIRIWDPATGNSVRAMAGHEAAVTSLCTVGVGGGTLLVSASADKSVQVWDPFNGVALYELIRGSGLVRAVTPVCWGGRSLLAVGGADRTIRFWDVESRTQEAVIPVHHTVHSVVNFDKGIVAGLSRGVVAIALDRL